MFENELIWMLRAMVFYPSPAETWGISGTFSAAKGIDSKWALLSFTLLTFISMWGFSLIGILFH